MNVNLCVGEGGIQLQFQFYFPYLNFKFLHTNKTLEGDQLDDNSIFFFFTCKCKKNVCCEKKGRGMEGGGVSYLQCFVVQSICSLKYDI